MNYPKRILFPTLFFPSLVCGQTEDDKRRKEELKHYFRHMEMAEIFCTALVHLES